MRYKYGEVCKVNGKKVTFKELDDLFEKKTKKKSMWDKFTLAEELVREQTLVLGKTQFEFYSTKEWVKK